MDCQSHFILLSDLLKRDSIYTFESKIMEFKNSNDSNGTTDPEGRDLRASWAKMMELMPEEMKQKAGEFHGTALNVPPMPKLVFDS